jgi:hypothetical protein
MNWTEVDGRTIPWPRHLLGDPRLRGCYSHRLRYQLYLDERILSRAEQPEDIRRPTELYEIRATSEPTMAGPGRSPRDANATWIARERDHQEADRPDYVNIGQGIGRHGAL